MRDKDGRLRCDRDEDIALISLRGYTLSCYKKDYAKYFIFDAVSAGQSFQGCLS